MKTTTLYPIILVIIFLTLSQSASAQDYGFYNQMFSNMLSNRIWDNIYQRSSPGYAAAKEELAASTSNSSGRAAPAPATPERMNRAVQFRSTGTRLMTQKFAEGLGNKLKADKVALSEMFTAILERYDADAAAKGLRNDLALAMVSYIALNSHVYSGGKTKSVLDLEQHPGHRDEVAQYAAQNGTFDRMNDRQRQEMYEALVLAGVYTHLMYNQAQKNNGAKALKEAKNLAKQNLKSIGVRL